MRHMKIDTIKGRQRERGKLHPLNNWDDIARARSEYDQPSATPYIAVWVVITALIASLGILLTMERHHDRRWQPTATVKVMSHE